MQKELQVFLPYPKSCITQRFGANANYSYARDGLKGHTAYDWGEIYDTKSKKYIGAAWGSPIPNCTFDAYCYSHLNEGNKDLNAYRAVFFLVETETGLYEVSYGHLSTFEAQVGKTYQPGDVIGYVGNTGDVFVGDHEVTALEKNAGSHAGAHLHGPQVRPVKKVTKRSSKKQYLQDSKGVLKKDGFYFEVIDYNNGFNGCVSLAPFSTETLATDYKASIPPPPPITEHAQALQDFAGEIAKEIPSMPEPRKIETQNALQKLFEAIKKILYGGY